MPAIMLPLDSLKKSLGSFLFNLEGDVEDIYLPQMVGAAVRHVRCHMIKTCLCNLRLSTQVPGKPSSAVVWEFIRLDR